MELRARIERQRQMIETWRNMAISLSEQVEDLQEALAIQQHLIDQPEEES